MLSFQSPFEANEIYIICKATCFKLKPDLNKKCWKLKTFFNFRSSHQRCSVEIVVLKNLANFTRKHLWWLLLNFLQILLKVSVKKIISQYSFSRKFSSNYFLVLAATFLKITPLQVFQNYRSFALQVLNMSDAYLERSQTSRWSHLRKQCTVLEVY